MCLTILWKLDLILLRRALLRKLKLENFVLTTVIFNFSLLRLAIEVNKIGNELNRIYFLHIPHENCTENEVSH